MVFKLPRPCDTQGKKVGAYALRAQDCRVAHASDGFTCREPRNAGQFQSDARKLTGFMLPLKYPRLERRFRLGTEFPH